MPSISIKEGAMRYKIDNHSLAREIDGIYAKCFCPYVADTSPCGDWCPHFEETVGNNPHFIMQ